MFCIARDHGHSKQGFQLLQAYTSACLAGLLFITSTANAWVSSLSPGIAYSNNGRSQTLLLEDSPLNLSNEYMADHDWHNSLSVQAFIGKDCYQQKNFKLRSGLSLSYIDDIRSTGTVNQLALSSFNNLSYHYSIQSMAALADLKLILTMSPHWQPYFDAGIGFANNHSYGYQENPLLTGAVATSPFSGRSKNNFAYRIGVGIYYPLTKVFAIGFGYQFFDVGRAELGPSAAQDTTQTPSIRHVVLQQALLHFSWQI